MNKILKFSTAVALILCVGASCTDLKVVEADSVLLSSDDTFKAIDPTAGLLTLYKDLSTYTALDVVEQAAARAAKAPAA